MPQDTGRTLQAYFKNSVHITNMTFRTPKDEIPANNPYYTFFVVRKHQRIGHGTL